MFILTFDFQTNECVIVIHSQDPDCKSIHGKVLPLNTNTNQCPFPTIFLWHECYVCGFHLSHDNRTVSIKRGGLKGGGFMGVMVQECMYDLGELN